MADHGNEPVHPDVAVHGAGDWDYGIVKTSARWTGWDLPPQKRGRNVRDWAKLAKKVQERARSPRGQ